MVVVLDSETGKEITTVDIPGDIDDLFYDGQRKQIYGTCGEGFLAVIRQMDADHYELAEKIPAAKLARTSLFDAKNGLLYVVLPRQPRQNGPEIRVYRTLP
jgi:hypothetical protein